MAGDEAQNPASTPPKEARRPSSALQYCGNCRYSVEGLDAFALCPECGAGPEERRTVGAGRVRHAFVIIPLSAAMLLTVVPPLLAFKLTFAGPIDWRGIFVFIGMESVPYLLCYIVIVLVNKPRERGPAFALAVPPALLISLTMGWMLWTAFGIARTTGG